MLDAMRRIVSVLGGVLVATTGCREPDLGPLRADLASSGEIVCAAPAARPPHAARTREVKPAEIESAIAKLCEAEMAHAETPAEPLAILHEALLQERAVMGQVRRSRMMIDAARVDLGALKPNKEGMRTAEEALTKAAAMRCGPSWPGLDRVMLAWGVARNKAEHAAEALDECVDVIALVRDEDLTGDMTDVLLANSQLQRAVATCGPIIDAAPKEAANSAATSLAIVRAAFPRSLEEARRRDRAEMVLFAFGKGGDPARSYGCERATAFAAGEGPGGKPLTRGDRIDLEKAWQTAHAEHDAPDPKYEEAYTLSLGLLDRLIARARAR
jgi:hypothetical protein